MNATDARPTSDGMAAFTLIEMLVVITIIALLVSLLLPTLQAFRETARIATCASNLRQQHIGAFNYANDFGGRLPQMSLMGNVTGKDQIEFTHWSRWGFLVSDFSGTETGQWQNLGRLVPGGHMVDPRAYFCPSQPQVSFRFEHYDDPWPSPNSLAGAVTSGTGIRFSYNFNPRLADGPLGMSLLHRTRRYQHLRELDPHDVFVMDMVESSDSVAHRAVGGFNVCRGNGSVSFAQTPSVIDEIDANPCIQYRDYFAWDTRVLDQLLGR